MRLDDLVVYRESKNLGKEIWEIVETWNDFHKQIIGTQLLRSVDSVSANIAEGYGRLTYKENRRFCIYARGSMMETLCWIEKAENRKLISTSKASFLNMKISRILRLLNNYIKAIEKLQTSK